VLNTRKNVAVFSWRDRPIACYSFSMGRWEKWALGAAVVFILSAAVFVIGLYIHQARVLASL